MRWRVKYSVRTSTWFSAANVAFVDAEDAHEAKAVIEERAAPGSAREVWAVTPATADMERTHEDWLRRCAEWTRRAKEAKPTRGLL